MAEIPFLIKDLALILMVAGIVTLIFKRLKQPLVLGYIMAGFLVSPHMSYTMSVVDETDIQTWADIGVIFTLFSLGLDFSFKKIVKMGASPIIATVVIVFCMMMLGISVGHGFGWGRMDCIFLGGMLAMSSTTIIYKAFDDMRLRTQKFASMVMSVLILEDILAIVMMVMLSAIASGSSPDGGQMLASIVKIGFFLGVWFIVGIFAIPWFLRSVRKLINAETLLIVSLGLCCGMAVLSTKVGFSSAFGAFVMGSILAETIEAEKIIKLVEPVKNLFGAIFFVSVGMLVDPKILVEYAVPILALVGTILVGQAIFGTFGFMLGGESLKSAMRCGFSMAQIGEFSFIIASLGLSLGVISKFLYPVVVAVSVITTFLTPYMIRLATPTYQVMEKHLPDKLIHILNHFAMSHPQTQQQSKWKSLIRQMLVNTTAYSILSAAVIALMFTFVLPLMRNLLPGWHLHWYANAITGLLTVLFISPFLRAIVMKKNHSAEWKRLWVESSINRVPLLFTVFVRFMIALAFIFYIINFLSRFTNALIVCIGAAVVMLMITSRRIKKRSIVMERVFVHNLRSRDIAAQVNGEKRPLYEGRLLDRDIHISEFEVPEDSSWTGKSLRELHLRQRFGVDLSSIHRGSHRLNIPNGDMIIFPGDKLQVIGNDDQLQKFNTALQSDLLPEEAEIEKREMKLSQLIISSSSEFLGKTLIESGIRDQYNCMVVGLEEGRENLTLLHGDMEATLFHLIFNIAAVLVAEIAEHLGEHPFQGIILHLSARLFTGLNLLVAVVADIEGSTIEMTRILGSIAVSGTQFRHIILGTQNARHDNLMQRNALDLQRIEISPADILEQHRGARHQVRNTVVQFVDIKERIAAHIHQLALAVLRLKTVLYRFHTMLSSRQNLHILLVRESIAEMRHREDAMLHLLAILIEEDRWLATLFRIRHNREFILLQVLSHISISTSGSIRNLSRRSIRSSRILRSH